MLAASAAALAMASGTGPAIGGCPVFPPDNPWNQDVASAPVEPHSDAYVAAISRGGNRFLHADFGGGGAYGIPRGPTWPSDRRPSSAAA
jgi:hypothetical protein